MPSQIGRMIIIDRECDFVTPILTQLSYQGMIDEVIGVRDGIVLYYIIDYFIYYIKLSRND
jgi:hypothetical protein